MALRKDESRAKKDNSAENFNVIRQIVLTNTIIYDKHLTAYMYIIILIII